MKIVKVKKEKKADTYNELIDRLSKANRLLDDALDWIGPFKDYSAAEVARIQIAAMHAARRANDILKEMK